MPGVLLLNVAGLLSFCLPLVWPCNVAIHPMAPIVAFGGSVKLNCTATCTNYTKIEWEVSFLRDVQAGEGWISLNIKNVTEWTPQPLCWAKYNNSDSIRNRAIIYVYQFSTPEIYLPSEIESGHSGRIVCNISTLRVRDEDRPNINISLSRGATLLISGHGQSLEYSFMANINRDDGAEILCAAQVQVGSEVLNKSATRTLNVVASPYNVSVSTDHITYQANADIEVTCEAEGKPSPEFSWNLPSKDNVKFSNKNRILTIHSAQSSHNGTYRCLVHNIYGKKWAEVNILFQEKPRNWTAAAVAVVVVLLLAAAVALGICWHRRQN